MNAKKDWVAVLMFISATILPGASAGAALQGAPGKPGWS